MGFLRLLQLAAFDRQEKINTGNPTVGERRGPGQGVRQLKSHVNTNSNFREEKRTVH